MTARTRRFALTTLAALATIGAASSLDAQQPATSPAGVGPSQQQQTAAGPTVHRAAVAARPLSSRPITLDDAEAAMQSLLGLGQARALMIVGFAAVVIGLLMDNDPGTLIAVGGAVVGLYGLYHYLK